MELKIEDGRREGKKSRIKESKRKRGEYRPGIRGGVRREAEVKEREGYSK